MTMGLNEFLWIAKWLKIRKQRVGINNQLCRWRKFKADFLQPYVETSIFKLFFKKSWFRGKKWVYQVYTAKTKMFSRKICLEDINSQTTAKEIQFKSKVI